MSRLVIHQHLGLGDHIDCNGMIRYILEKSEFDTVELFAKKHYASMVDHMFRVTENVIVIPVDGNEYVAVEKYMREQTNCNFLRVGHEHYRDQEGKNCWEIFYEQLDIPLSVKDEYFYIKPDPEEEERVFQKLNPNKEEFIFVHDDPSRGFTIEMEEKYSDIHQVKNDMSENIFHFAKILKEAKEIHVMESSFKSVIEHLPSCDKIYFHDFRGHPLGKTKKNWEIVEYVS